LLFAHLLHQPPPAPTAWLRAFGVTTIGLQLVLVPGLVNPLFCRWPNWAGIATNFLLTLVFLFSGLTFWPLAAWNLAFGAALSVTYSRLRLAEILGEP
jgi:hypothetical protein